VGCEEYAFKPEGEGYCVHRCDIKLPENPEARSNFKFADLNYRWPYDDETFDVVRAVEIVEHLENPWHLFREAKRVLKHGGVLVFSTPNLESPANRKLFYEKGELHWFASWNPRGKPHHITPLFMWQIEEICKELGLAIEVVRYNDEDSTSLGFQEIRIVRVRKP